MLAFNIIITLLIPIIMIFGGVSMVKVSLKNPNGIIGYRTSLSMKNQDTWKLANEYCGRLWVKLGIIFLILSAISCVSYFFIGTTGGDILSVVIVLLQTVLMLITLIPVEKRLHKIFNNDGTKK